MPMTGPLTSQNNSHSNYKIRCFYCFRSFVWNELRGEMLTHDWQLLMLTEILGCETCGSAHPWLNYEVILAFPLLCLSPTSNPRPVCPALQGSCCTFSLVWTALFLVWTLVNCSLSLHFSHTLFAAIQGKMQMKVLILSSKVFNKSHYLQALLCLFINKLDII